MTHIKEWHDHIRRVGSYRSKFEADIARQLEEAGADFSHEADRLEYRNSEGRKVYVPDFTIRRPDGSVFFVEAKGWMDRAATLKMRAVRVWNPDADIRFVFQSGSTKPAGLKSTVCQWAKRVGYPHAVGTVPPGWLV